MACKTSSAHTISLLLTLVASMLIHSPPCLARFPPETKSLYQPENYDINFFDGLSPLQPCLAALANTGGCVGEFQRFSSGQDTKFKDVCCKSMVQIDDDCWAKILPSQPFFPTMINSYCASLLRGAPGDLPVGGGPGGAAGGAGPGGLPGGVGGGPGGVVGLPGGVVGGAAGGALPTPP